MAGRKMHQTTVRFGPDLWQEIEAQAEHDGVSVAQYVRDSALMRIAYTRGREGDLHYEAALRAVDPDETARRRLREATDRARDVVEGAQALASQTTVALRRTRQVRDAAQTSRGRRSDEDG